MRLELPCISSEELPLSKRRPTIQCNVSGSTLGQTVEKPRVQLGKTVPREFPRAQPKRTPKGQFFQAARGFSTVSQTLLTP